MFFIIAGIQPKTINLDEQPRLCPSCGLYQARLQRTDHYFSFFFLPLFPVRKGDPFLQCQRCGAVIGESGETNYIPRQDGRFSCSSCGKPLDSEYRFCPFCGKRQ
ncbi:MAG TPA: zinc-ribbon domain-containing protein [Desulfobacteraceae bacterium]|nr:zinc-ribbon domain-containing protein [Desulfobacteraceae bacterium]HPJ66236.1 zinc-ribbon domain-containing protein [Desulfobacteraceae bacterium]HPQ27169.1 zinc-ribbon domain-containing protein [Desulfobacteraceae bacterium]